MLMLLLYVSGVKTPPVLEKKPSPRRVPYSSHSAYNSAGRKIKGRGAVVSSLFTFIFDTVELISHPRHCRCRRWGHSIVH